VQGHGNPQGDHARHSGQRGGHDRAQRQRKVLAEGRAYARVCESVWHMCVCEGVCASARVCVCALWAYACVRACARVCACVGVCASARVFVCALCAYARACVCERDNV